jgi:ribonuclease HII
MLFDSRQLPIHDTPDFTIETRYLEAGLVCGVDEAGRGPLAGPVVTAAVVLDPMRVPDGLNDSKKLTEKAREALFLEIMAVADVSIAAAPPMVIDRRNIRGATLWAMARAVAALPRVPGMALIDGRDVPPELPCPGAAVIKGDARSLSIAAASIIAKVTRDRMCAIIHCAHPDHGMDKHKGYPSPAHLMALDGHGVTPHHRTSYAPVRERLERKR